MDSFVLYYFVSFVIIVYNFIYYFILTYFIIRSVDVVLLFVFACNAKSFADACFFLLLLLICVSLSYWQMFSAYLPHPFPRKRVARIGLISLVTLTNVIASVLFIVKFGLGQHYLCYREKRNENLKHKLGRMVIWLEAFLPKKSHDPWVPWYCEVT